MKHAILSGIAALAVAATLSGTALAADISGAGSTFIYPVFAKWADTYKAATGTGLNYQSIGSGGGIKQVEAKTVTFGATDKPLSDAELAKNGLVQFPMVMGGIVPIVNIDGIKPGALVLDGPTLANIFLGKVTSWDDAAIKALNPTLTLPSAAIVVAHRSDGSGTTFNFTDYLGKESTDWADQIGSDTAVEWPVGVGAKGSEGIANTVKQTNGAIGYVEYAYAAQNGLSFTKMVNAAGKTVAPSIDTFAAAVLFADFASVKIGTGACRARPVKFFGEAHVGHYRGLRVRYPGHRRAQSGKCGDPGQGVLLPDARLRGTRRRAAPWRHGLAADRRLAGPVDLWSRLRVDAALEPGEGDLRRARAHLRHHHHVADRHDHRHSGELRHRGVPDRALSAAAAPPDRRRHRAARRHSFDHLRPVGLLLPCTVPADNHPAGADRLARQAAGDRPSLRRRALRHRLADRGHHPCHHGAAVHHLDHSRRVSHSADAAARKRLRHGHDHVGSGDGDHHPLHPRRPRRRHHARARPRAGRNHGGDLRHR